MNKNKKVSVITLGCSKNTVDSERLMKQIELNNFKLCNDPNDADTVIINTCGFIEAAKEESVNTILNAAMLKEKGQIKNIIVAGCLSKRYEKDLKLELPEVDSFFGTEDYEAIIKHLGGELKYDLLGERKLTSPSHTAYLKISEGCNHPCSFCAIPLMRGKHVSRPINDLIKEAEFLADNGARELVLIAQDTTDYGKDIYNKSRLAYLLNEFSKIDGIEWIRLMYAYPSQFPGDVITEIASNPKVLKYIDLPLQHISDPVLKSMRRGVTAGRTKELINKLRNEIPGLVLRTTFIVGYPAETEKDFNELCRFVEETGFDRVGVFTFSMEENTSSFILGDPVSSKLKAKRKERLMEIQKEISLKMNKSLQGNLIKVLVDGKEGDFYVARSYRDAPEVDGEILIPVNDYNLQAGNFYTVKIYDYNEYDLFAIPDKTGGVN